MKLPYLKGEPLGGPSLERRNPALIVTEVFQPYNMFPMSSPVFSPSKIITSNAPVTLQNQLARNVRCIDVQDAGRELPARGENAARFSGTRIWKTLSYDTA